MSKNHLQEQEVKKLNMLESYKECITNILYSVGTGKETIDVKQHLDEFESMASEEQKTPEIDYLVTDLKESLCMMVEYMGYKEQQNNCYVRTSEEQKEPNYEEFIG